MKEFFNIILEDWPIVLALIVVILVLIRLIMTNPKYSLKEITKNPLLIFRLFAKAATEVADIIEEATELMDDARENIEDLKETVGNAEESVKELKDSIKK